MKNIVREIIHAGSNVYVRVFAQRPRKEHGQARRQKEYPTSEAMRRQNEYNATRHLSIVIDQNFGVGDLHVQLTYRTPATQQEAKKYLNKAIRDLRALYRSRGVPWKYIAVT